MQRTKWTDRKFNFDHPEGWIFNIIERLRGAPVRLSSMTAGGMIIDDIASLRPHGKWSVKEHVGHLIDLEELHDGRLDDFEAGRDILRAADMENIKTRQADHNNRHLEDLLEEFAEVRHAFTNRLSCLDDGIMSARALHPRLQVMMRPVDVAFFTAEHDDHHLATIRELLNALS